MWNRKKMRNKIKFQCKFVAIFDVILHRKTKSIHRRYVPASTTIWHFFSTRNDIFFAFFLHWKSTQFYFEFQWKFTLFFNVYGTVQYIPELVPYCTAAYRTFKFWLDIFLTGTVLRTYTVRDVFHYGYLVSIVMYSTNWKYILTSFCLKFFLRKVSSTLFYLIVCPGGNEK